MKLRHLGFSLFLHALILSLFFIAAFKKQLPLLSSYLPIPVELSVDPKYRKIISKRIQRTAWSQSFKQKMIKIPGIDYSAPSDAGAFNTNRLSYSGRNENSAKFSRELLTTESKEIDIFDALARRINRHLDYPSMLVENSIYGYAALDLYFDSSGDIDEARSKTFGDNRYVRGLLVRAARQGLEEWLPNDAIRLRKEQFRNQYFRADFIISYSQSDKAELLKTGPRSYGFLRRRVSNITCMGEFAGAPMLNIACIAAGLGGALHRTFSEKYKGQVGALKDLLESYDQINLDGINAIARRT